ncbi:hypothetical protein QV65_23050 [Rhodococcus erythropolis]|nr:hypothetical protein QV65_23050 [Rhodococcus erythropolis]
MITERLPQDVADSADGVDQPRFAVGFRLATQVADVHLERIAGRREVVPPHLFENASTGEHATRVGHEHFEEGKLGAGQADRSLSALDLTGDRVEGEVLEGHHFGIGVQIGRGATQ